MRIAYDMSSFIWRGMLAGKDLENGKQVMFADKEVLVNSAEYGYENVVNMMLEVMQSYDLTPINCILVIEGVSSKSKRILISASYKESRESRPPEAYTEFHKCKEMLMDTWLALGASTVEQAYCEGDDTLAWLAQEAEEKLIIATYDNDMAACNTDKNKYGAEVEVWINGLRGTNKYGMFPYHLITAYKSLVGDSGDNIPGCKGFGPKAFETFVATYGLDGLQEFYDLCKAGSLAPLQVIENDKLIAKILEQQEGVLTSFELALLRPEWVNTIHYPLKIKRGLVQYPPKDVDDRLLKYYAKIWLVDANNFIEATRYALAKISKSPFVALDIETSAPDESDAWLEAKGNPNGVDVFGSSLTGLGLTFGDNQQYTMYFSVNHANTDNCSSELLCNFINSIECEICIQNTSFELTVLHQEWSKWVPLNRGFLRNVLDTMLEASYVDENSKRGLKERSLAVLGYQQETYAQVTQITDVAEKLPVGGRELNTLTLEDGTVQQTRQYKMRELSAAHVLNYGADDTRCTSALHLYYKDIMTFCEHTYRTYKEVEIPAAYANAKSFLDGIPFSMERMRACEDEDTASVNLAWPVLRGFLIANGWGGTVPPVYTKDITPAEVKEAFLIVTGRQLDTMIRTMPKLVVLIREIEKEVVFAGMLERCLAGEAEVFTAYVNEKFAGEPIFNSDSPVQMKKLMYETLKLPIRLTNKVTDAQRARGETVGTSKTDSLAVQTALHYDSETADLSVLKAIETIKQCGTRSKLFYRPYANLQHWKDNLLHPSTNQCATVTRRNSASDPNYTQWPAKGDGIKFRECIVASGPDRVIISADCSGQELRLAAEFSRDENMLSCYIGDNKKDIHSIVAAAAAKYIIGKELTYKEFYSVLKGEDEVAAEEMDVLRTKAKAVNFGEIYGSQAASLSNRLMISEEEAQLFLDAKKAMFPGVDIWKNKVVTEARITGYSTTLLGARRHMRQILATGNKWEVSKAERQLSNYCIQGSGAEAIKIALGKVFYSELMTKCDVKIIGSIHDEIVLDCPASAAYEVATELVKFMEAPYRNMIVPFISECTIGRDFGKQLKLPQKFTFDDVQEKLVKLFGPGLM